MSKHLRSHYEAMLQSMNSDIVRRIAQGRRIPEDAVRRLQGERLFSANAAKAEGYNTAFVRRPREWGNATPPDPEPNPIHDIIVDDFPALAGALGVNA